MLGVAGVEQASGSHFEGATSFYRVFVKLGTPQWTLKIVCGEARKLPCSMVFTPALEHP
jgi:hypothetical protein